jgi:hypothetical protein
MCVCVPNAKLCICLELISCTPNLSSPPLTYHIAICRLTRRTTLPKPRCEVILPIFVFFLRLAGCGVSHPLVSLVSSFSLVSCLKKPCQKGGANRKGPVCTILEVPLIKVIFYGTIRKHCAFCVCRPAWQYSLLPALSVPKKKKSCTDHLFVALRTRFSQRTHEDRISMDDYPKRFDEYQDDSNT